MPNAPCLPIWALLLKPLPLKSPWNALRIRPLSTLEGYLLFNQELMTTALQIAKKAGAAISLDLASFTVVEQARDFPDADCSGVCGYPVGQ